MSLLKRTNGAIIKITALCLILALTAPISVSAAGTNNVMPLASYYLDAYNTYICDMGDGEFQIWYEVMGTGWMDEIGVLSILVYESSDYSNWTWVDTFLHEDHESMLAYDDWYHYSHVTYYGTDGMYYKAYVCIWAGKNGDGDTRYMWARM